MILFVGQCTRRGLPATINTCQVHIYVIFMSSQYLLLFFSVSCSFCKDNNPFLQISLKIRDQKTKQNCTPVYRRWSYPLCDYKPNQIFGTSEPGPIMDDVTFCRNLLNLVWFFDNSFFNLHDSFALGIFWQIPLSHILIVTWTKKSILDTAVAKLETR